MSGILELLDALYRLELMPYKNKFFTTLVALNKISDYGGFNYQYDEIPELGSLSLYDFEHRRGHGTSMRRFGNVMAEFWNYVVGDKVFDYVDFAWHAPNLNEIIGRIIQHYNSKNEPNVAVIKFSPVETKPYTKENENERDISDGEKER